MVHGGVNPISMDPFRWSKPRRIFTDSMSDLFYEDVPTSVVDNVVAVMMICCLHETRGGHTFQTLTKRPQRMREYFEDPGTLGRVAKAAGSLMDDGVGWHDAIAFRKNGLLHSKMWWGTSIENQAAAAERIVHLLSTPAVVRFLSCEPLIGPIDFTKASPNARSLLEDIDWVIAGCESGPGARECDTEWLREVRDQCAISSVSFFLKQAEESADCGEDRHLDDLDDDSVAFGDGSKMKARRPQGNHIIELPYLDGKQHATFPTPSTECDA